MLRTGSQRPLGGAPVNSKCRVAQSPCRPWACAHRSGYKPAWGWALRWRRCQGKTGFLATLSCDRSRHSIGFCATAKPQTKSSAVKAEISKAASQNNFQHEARAGIGQQQQSGARVEDTNSTSAAPAKLVSAKQQSTKGEPGQD